MKILRWSCDRWLTNLWQVSCVMLLFCEDPKVVNRRSCEHFVKISWQLLMRSRAVIWHPGDYFVTSYCDEWQLFDGWKIIFRRLVDDSVKMFYPSDDFATITESLYDDLETTLWQASTKGQLYNNTLWQPYKSSYDDLVTMLCHVTTQWRLLILKAKYCQLGSIVVTGGTVICHNDNLKCHQWWQCCQVDNILLSVKISHAGPMTIR